MKGTWINLKLRDRKYNPPSRRRMESDYFWPIIWPSNAPSFQRCCVSIWCFTRTSKLNETNWIWESEPGKKKCVWHLKGSEAVALILWSLWSIWTWGWVDTESGGVLVIFSLLCSPLLWILTWGFLRLQTLRGDSRLFLRSTFAFSH